MEKEVREIMGLCSRKCEFCPGEEALGRITRLKQTYEKNWRLGDPTEVIVTITPPNDDVTDACDSVFGNVDSVSMRNELGDNLVHCYFGAILVNDLWPAQGEKRFSHDEGIWFISE